MYKASIMEAKAKVEKVIQSCETRSQLESARQMALNFGKLYYLGLNIDILFPSISKKRNTMKYGTQMITMPARMGSNLSSK